MNFLKTLAEKVIPTTMSKRNFEGGTLQTVFFECPDNNGFYFNGTYVPEEIVNLILSHVEGDVLNCALVCKSWHNIVKSFGFWARKYERKFGKKAKKFPWYVYYCLFNTDFFDEYRLKNNCGELDFEHWKILKNYGDEFRVENPPAGADELPSNVKDFNGHTSCFATSYYECCKEQDVPLDGRPVYSLILDTYKPHIYASEWVAGRFDCGSTYTLRCTLHGKNEKFIADKFETFHVEQWAGSTWSKVMLLKYSFKKG